MKGKATKTGNGWHVDFSEEFLSELKELPQEDQDEIMEIMKGLEDGSIDPMTMGKRMCGYCGMEIDKDTEKGIDMCPMCITNYR